MGRAPSSYVCTVFLPNVSADTPAVGGRTEQTKPTSMRRLWQKQEALGYWLGFKI